MIEGNQYIEVVNTYFNFLISEFGFKLSEEIINGNFFYRLRYLDKTKAITISYENIEDYLSVFISILCNGELPDYDDKMKTIHLNKINAMVLSQVTKEEITINNEHFLMFKPKNELEKKLLKSAKELRLCLNHFSDLKIT